jgi:hypothetical protein
MPAPLGPSVSDQPFSPQSNAPLLHAALAIGAHCVNPAPSRPDKYHEQAPISHPLCCCSGMTFHTTLPSHARPRAATAALLPLHDMSHRSTPLVACRLALPVQTKSKGTSLDRSMRSPNHCPYQPLGVPRLLRAHTPLATSTVPSTASCAKALSALHLSSMRARLY